jgi:hypothetical protein
VNHATVLLVHYRKQIICHVWITDGKDFAVRKLPAKSDGKDMSAKSTLPSAIYQAALPSAGLITDSEDVNFAISQSQ